MNRKILYITYDGLTDPLGQSQILPYLSGLSKEGYQFTILSFEKKDRFGKLEATIRKITTAANIRWVPLRFTSRPPVLSKMYDRMRLKRKALVLHRQYRFDMIHCRGYISAEAGLAIKRKFGIKFFFDMRGFWADEKKDGGAWPQHNFLFRRVYRHYKKKEAQFIKETDCIVSLTEAGKREIVKWPSYNDAVPLQVIPCCADMNVFSLIKPGDKQAGRQMLGLDENDLVISYLGSVGSWYMLNEMLEFFSVMKEKYSNAKFLFITHSPFSLILSKLGKYNLSGKDILLTEAERHEVPLYVKASDINVSFIRPVYSKLSSSPTKLAEVMAMGIPVIVNGGVGDVQEVVEKSKAGIVINDFTKETYKNIVDRIPALLQTDRSAVRQSIEPLFSLHHGIELYSKAYKEVFGKD